MGKNGFTSEGFESFPSLYHDTERIHTVLEWPSEVLISRITEYAKFAARTDNMPRAQETADRILSHMQFEVGQRELDEIEEAA